MKSQVSTSQFLLIHYTDHAETHSESLTAMQRVIDMAMACRESELCNMDAIE